MAMLFKKESVLINIPASETIKKCRFSVGGTGGTSDVTGYYTDDNPEKYQLFVDFFDGFSLEWYVDAVKFKEYAKDIEKYVRPYSHKYVNKMDSFRHISNFFSSHDVKIPAMFFGGLTGRYLKFDNSDDMIKNLKESLFEGVSNLVIEKRGKHFYVYPEMKKDFFKKLAIQVSDIPPVFEEGPKENEIVFDSNVLRDEFKKWLSKTKKNNDDGYTDKVQSNYFWGVGKASEYLNIDIYSIFNYKKMLTTLNLFLKDDSLMSKDKDVHNYIISNALKLYNKFFLEYFGIEIFNEEGKERKYFILPSNPNIYNAIQELKDLGMTYWGKSKSRGFSIGDTVYLYSASPIQKITAKLIVENIDFDGASIPEENHYWIKGIDQQHKDKAVQSMFDGGGKFDKLVLVKLVDDERLSYQALKEHGLKSFVQSSFELKENSKELVDYIESIFNEENTNMGNKIFEPRTDTSRSLNTIIYGAPGTGKTYSVVEYALSLIEKRSLNLKNWSDQERKDLMENYNKTVKEGRIVFTTFHQNYSYEDFIQGLRPISGENGNMSFAPVDGVFKRLVTNALKEPDKNYVMIIDEINRANISKVLGELITLLEEDKRYGEINQLSATLPSGEEFKVPNNLYIIGTMNTADKSISLIDMALRRRFEFIEQKVDIELVKQTNETLAKILGSLNKVLSSYFESTDLLIGHAYFINQTLDKLPFIMNNKVIPLIYEYYSDNTKLIKKLLEDSLKDTDFKVVESNVERLKVAKK
jgi:Cdc6-like AAA superfamily ATPase